MKVWRLIFVFILNIYKMTSILKLGSSFSVKSTIFYSKGLRMSTISVETPKIMYVLNYSYVEDILEKRMPHRSSHIEHAKSYFANGLLMSGGAFNPPTEGAMFLFKGVRSDVENFVENDPYVKAKLVNKFSIKEWTVVVGDI